MNAVDTSIEPPVFEEEDDGDNERVAVHCSLFELDGTYRNANTGVVGDDDESVAEAIIQAIQGLAAMRGPGLQAAISRRLR